MKLMFEAYCPACGGWDVKQGGSGHKLGCPVGEPGTPISSMDASKTFVVNFDPADIEMVYGLIKANIGTIINYNVTEDIITVYVSFDDVTHGKSFVGDMMREGIDVQPSKATVLKDAEQRFINRFDLS